jgi:hypothetical protein
MAEDQKLKSNQVQCWQCGEAVYKGTKHCPKCNAPSPAADIAKLRKMAPIVLRVGVPVGIASLIAGFILLVKGISIFGMMGYATFGVEIACLLIGIGIAGVVAGPVMRSFLNKVDRATRGGQ